MTEPEKTESAHTATSESTDAPASEPAPEPPEPVEAKDDEDEDEDDEKKSKKKKKKDKEKDEEEDEEEDEDEGRKKAKISFEATMPRNEAVSYFEAIVAGLRSGRLEFKQGDQTLVLNPPEHLEIEVKAKSKGDKGSVVFEIEWSDENRPLEISN